MTRWDLLCSVAQTLRPIVGTATLPGTLARSDFPWPDFVRCASLNLVTPAVAYALQDSENLPPELADYLAEMLRLNRERNERLLREAWVITKELNGQAIEPVFMKGLAMLQTQAYTDPGLRVIADIDMLVPEDRWLDAANVVQSLGYVAQGSPVSGRDSPAYPAQVHPTTGIVVEIHRAVMPRELSHLIPAAALLARSRRTVHQDAAARLPDWTHLALHSIVHSELKDKASIVRRVALRPLLDLAILQTQHGSKVDWPDLVQTLKRSGHGGVWENLSALSAHLLAVELTSAARLRWYTLPIYRFMSEHPYLIARAYYLALMQQLFARQIRSPGQLRKFLKLKTYKNLLFNYTTMMERIRGGL